MSIRGNTIGSTSPRADWAEQDPTKASFIRNKPENISDLFTEEDIENITTLAENVHRLEYMMAPNSVVTFQYSTTRNVSLISCRGSTGAGHAVVLYSGYGYGGATRSTATILLGSGNVLCAVLPEGTGNGVTIWNETNVTCSVSVLELLGELPAAVEGDGGSTKPTDASNILITKGYASQNFAPAGYGLGTMGKECSDCNAAKKSGWYSLSGDSCLNTPPSFANMKYGAMEVVNRYDTYIAQIIYYQKYMAIRHSSDGGTIWAEWEHINPPMTVGVEYRTTERYQGAAVYKKVDASGNILWRKDGETKWRLLSAASYVATATVE